MAEEALELRGLPKPEAYAALVERVDLVLDGISDPIAGMATIATLVQLGFGHLWTGFYRVAEPDTLLRVGPYQGSLAVWRSPSVGECAGRRRRSGGR